MSETDWNLYIKIISMPSLFLLCFIFGIIPYVIKKCRSNESFLSYANTFSGGLFFGIGEFHLLAEATQKLTDYSKLPLSFFLAFVGYSLILFVQKVALGYLMPSEEEILKANQETNNNTSLDNSNDPIKDDSLGKISFLNNSKDEDNANTSSNAEVTKTALEEKVEKEKTNQKKISGFIMLLALSIHGMFECLALGIQSDFRNTLFLFIALMIHKWAEAFTLGIFFIQAKMAKKQFYLIIFFFSLIAPVGIAIGMILVAEASQLVEGIFLSISTGTFLYVACSEVIVEEFSSPKKRYFKYFLYLVGGAFAVGLVLLEEYLK